jgi:hypothetical protein
MSRGFGCSVALSLTLLSTSALAEKFPFSGFFVSGVTEEAISSADYNSVCMIAPRYDNNKGEMMYFVLDLPHFRQTSKLRYRMKPFGFQLTYFEKQKVVMVSPTRERVKAFKGNSYYAPETTYRLVISATQSLHNYVEFRSAQAINAALSTGDYKYGDRRTNKRCKLSEDVYLKLAVDDSTLPSFSESEAREHFDILNNYSDPALLKRIDAEFTKLQ